MVANVVVVVVVMVIDSRPTAVGGGEKPVLSNKFLSANYLGCVTCSLARRFLRNSSKSKQQQGARRVVVGLQGENRANRLYKRRRRRQRRRADSKLTEP